VSLEDKAEVDALVHTPFLPVCWLFSCWDKLISGIPRRCKNQRNHTHAAVEESKQEDAQEWADSAAVDMSSEVGMHISNDVKCEYKLANEKCAPKLGDELVLSPVNSLIFMILFGVPALFLVIV
jgi:hypothetical protein